MENIAQRIKSYSYELSGGQRQRVMIAMSIANNPDLLIADEPTTALDVTVQLQILKLIKNLQQKLNMAILFISHDLTVVKNIADYICIMKEGVIVEKNTKQNIFFNPQHEYTKKLVNFQNKKKNSLAPESKKILEIKKLKVWYPIKKGILRRTVDHVRAVDSINLTLFQNQTLGIVGESGSGKTSLVLALLKLISFEGDVVFNNNHISKMSNNKLHNLRKDMQIIFQDPFSSLSPRMTIEEIVSEGLNIHEKHLSPLDKNNKIKQMMNEVGLNFETIYNRFPHEFSGGQRQRIAIARALILNPKLLILDEPTSSLDVTIQSQILDLLNSLQNKYQLSYIFISHNMQVINSVADYVIVLKEGKIVEEGNTKSIFEKPQKNYTKELLQSVI